MTDPKYQRVRIPAQLLGGGDEDLTEIEQQRAASNRDASERDLDLDKQAAN